jgi:hypothetical protein
MGWAYLTQEEAQRTIEPNTLTPPPPTVTTQPLQMLRLDRNSLNTEEGRPFVKMSANCDVIGTWRTRT